MKPAPDREARTREGSRFELTEETLSSLNKGFNCLEFHFKIFYLLLFLFYVYGCIA